MTVWVFWHLSLAKNVEINAHWSTPSPSRAKHMPSLGCGVNGPTNTFTDSYLKGGPKWRSTTGPTNRKGMKKYYEHFFSLLYGLLCSKLILESHENNDHECCHFGFGVLHTGCHKLGQTVWQKCTWLHHKPTIFCSLSSKEWTNKATPWGAQSWRVKGQFCCKKYWRRPVYPLECISEVWVV